MATYNGEAYLRQQIDSLLAQTYADFCLYVRDDGSTDHTVAIIKDYAAAYPDKVVFLESKEKHIGPRDGFMCLLESVDSDYYMFCDQDDLWLPFKVEDSIKAIKRVEDKYHGMPVLVGTDLRVTDENLMTLSDSFWKRGRINVMLRSRFNFSCIGNMCPGCSMAFNRHAKTASLPISPYAYMHDEWMVMSVAKHGKIVTLKYPTILYRQHNHNTIGAGESEGGIRNTSVYEKLFGFYYKRKPLLDAIGYGSVLKAMVYKVIYLILTPYALWKYRY